MVCSMNNNDNDNNNNKKKRKNKVRVCRFLSSQSSLLYFRNLLNQKIVNSAEIFDYIFRAIVD